MLQLAAIDTTEITDLTTYARVSAFDVLQRAKLDWRVDKRPVYLGTGEVIPGQFANVRSDNGRALGIVGNRYQVIQNQNGLDLFDVAAQRGAVEYGRAGTFNGGAIVWMQAKLPGSITVGPDEVDRFLLLANSHDGSGTLRILLTPIRVVCRNTLAMALSDKASGMTIRHTASADAKVRIAIRAIEQAGRSYSQFADMANALYTRRLSAVQTRQYVEAVFPVTGETSTVSTRLQNTRARIIDLAEMGKGQWAVRGTAWAAYNAVTEYVDHHRATRGEESNRLESALLGSGAAIKRRAFDLALSA